MGKNFTAICLFLFLAIISCTHQPKKITNISGERILIDSTFDVHPDSVVAEIVEKYKTKLNEQLYQVIGKSAQEMVSRLPESLLSNFSADAMLAEASALTKKPIDMAIMNLGGIRSTMPAGDIMLYNIYTIYPFENELVLLMIDGKALRELFEFFAKTRIEAFANAKLSIRKNEIVSVEVNGQPLDDNKMYTVVTLDFIAQGGDGLTMLSKAVSYDAVGILMRDAIVNYIKKVDSEGKMIDSKVDGRVTIL